MKQILLLSAILLLSLSIFSQESPVNWTINQERVADGSMNLIITAEIHHDWYIYGMNMSEGGPLPLLISFDNQQNVVDWAKFSEITPAETMYDEIFGMDVSSYQHHTEFKCNFVPKTGVATLNLVLDGQACNKVNGVCVQIQESIPFTISE